MDYLVHDSDLTAIAAAIRAKGATTASLEFPSDFISAVSNISTGIDISDTTLTASSQMLDGIAAYDANGSKIIGSILSKTSSDLTASGATVTVPQGNYASTASKTISTGSATAPNNISATGATVSRSGTTITLNKTISVTPTITTGYISSGTANNSAVYLSATDSNFIAENIKNGISIFGLTGSYSGGGGGGGIGTLLNTTSLGAISTSSTTAADTGKTAVITGCGNYDLLVCEVSVDTRTNGRHAATISLIWLASTSNITTISGATIATAKFNIKLSSNGTGAGRAGTTAYGVYVNTATVSSNNVTLAFYQKYNSTSTGTMNGNYTARTYGLNLYDLIGG